MENLYFDNPNQVCYQYKDSSCHYFGIAYGDIIISAPNGIVVSLRDVEHIRPLGWVSLEENIRGDLSLEDLNEMLEVK